MKKRGEILIENVVFIILNLAFLVILVLFLIKQGAGTTLLQESYAKQIALLIDGAPPNSILKLNMEKGKKISDKNEIPFDQIVNIQGNIVSVKLSSDSSSSYSFFKDVRIDNYYTDGNYYIFSIPEEEVILNEIS